MDRGGRKREGGYGPRVIPHQAHPQVKEGPADVHRVAAERIGPGGDQHAGVRQARSAGGCPRPADYEAPRRHGTEANDLLPGEALPAGVWPPRARPPGARRNAVRPAAQAQGQYALQQQAGGYAQQVLLR